MNSTQKRGGSTIQSVQILIKMALLFFLLSVCGSCNSLPLNNRKMEMYNILNDLSYSYTTMELTTLEDPIGQVLSNGELSTVSYWKKSKPKIKSFLIAECAGCSYQIEQLQPVYKVEKGGYIHFGLKDELGVQNWVFTKNKGFVNQFYTFQGDTQKELTKQSSQNLGKYSVLEGVFPIGITRRNMYLKHVIYNQNINSNGHWRQSAFPSEIQYEVDLRNKIPVKFKFNSGFYSYQGSVENERHLIINFVDTFFYILGGNSKPIYYNSTTDGYYANANFFQFSLEEESQISIELESNIKGKEFNFSVLKNLGYYTADEYLNRKGKQFTQYQKKLKKGEYLIRVIHENSDYMDTPLYNVKIDKRKIN